MQAPPAVNLFLTAALLVCWQSAAGYAQDMPPQGVTEHKYGVVNPSVEAEWFAERSTCHVDTLWIVVLRRGQPDWHEEGKAISQESGAGTVHFEADSSWVSGPFWNRITGSKHDMDIWYDPSEQVARVLDSTVAMGTDNVLLIDRIDGAGGAPIVAGTARIQEREVRNSCLPINELIKGITRLQDFLAGGLD